MFRAHFRYLLQLGRLTNLMSALVELPHSTQRQQWARWAGSGLAALGEWNAEADIGIDPVERQLSTPKRKVEMQPRCAKSGPKATIDTDRREHFPTLDGRRNLRLS